jgi:hypothetical protein
MDPESPQRDYRDQQQQADTKTDPGILFRWSPLEVGKPIESSKMPAEIRLNEFVHRGIPFRGQGEDRRQQILNRN